MTSIGQEAHNHTACHYINRLTPYNSNTETGLDPLRSAAMLFSFLSSCYRLHNLEMSTEKEESLNEKQCTVMLIILTFRVTMVKYMTKNWGKRHRPGMSRLVKACGLFFQKYSTSFRKPQSLNHDNVSFIMKRIKTLIQSVDFFLCHSQRLMVDHRQESTNSNIFRLFVLLLCINFGVAQLRLSTNI